MRGIGRALHQPVLAGDTVYVAVTGRLVAIDTSSGAERAGFDLGDRPVAGLTIVDDNVVVLLDGGELRAVSD
jgi:outer membrane protein assembly factor BamB